MNWDKFVKVITIAGFLSFAVGVIGSHVEGNLFPSITYGMILFLFFASISVVYTPKPKRLKLILFVAVLFISILYSWYIFTFPTSMVGWDPGKKAVAAQSIIEHGDISGINRPFYSKAPLFHILAAMFGLISNSPAYEALSIYTVVVNLGQTVFAFAIVTRILDLENSFRGSYSAAIIASVGAVSTNHSFWPFAQSLGIVLWAGLIYVIILLFDKRDFKTTLLPLILLSTSLIYTHKIQLQIFTISLFIFLILLYLFMGEQNYDGRKFIQILAGHTAILSFVQYFYISEFLGTTATIEVINTLKDQPVKKFYTTLAEVGILPGGQSTTTSIVSYPNGIRLTEYPRDYLINYGYAFVILSIGGIFWVVYINKAIKKRDTKTLFILSTAAAVVPLIFLTFVSSGTAVPDRFIMMGELPLSILIGLGLGQFLNESRKQLSWELTKRFIVIVLLITLVTSQVYSPESVPDMNGQQEKYLTAPDLATRSFNTQYIPAKIHSDFFFGNKPMAQPMKYGTAKQYKKFNKEILYGNISSNKYKYVSIRYKVVLTIEGIVWKPVNPSFTLEQKCSKIYSVKTTSTFYSCRTYME